MSSEADYCERVTRRRCLKKSETGIFSEPRHSGRERAETRGSFALEKDVSSCSRNPGWRPQLNFCRAKFFDDLHRPTALGAAPKISRVSAGGSRLFGLRLLCCAEQLKAKRQGRGTPTVGQETEVTDAHEAFRKHVQ